MAVAAFAVSSIFFYARFIIGEKACFAIHLETSSRSLFRQRKRFEIIQNCSDTVRRILNAFCPKSEENIYRFLVGLMHQWEATITDKRIRGTLILSLVFMSVTNPCLAYEDVSSIAKKILPATVLIRTYDAQGKALEIGSGFFVDKEGDIVTCYHVMKGSSSANVTTSDKRDYRVKNIIAINKTNDLIRLSLSTARRDFNSLKLNTATPDVGQEIIVVGGPLGLENTVSEGIVSAVRENQTQITAPVSLGSSGGPVVNMKGEVIGIVSSQMRLGQNLNFAIPSIKISTMKPASTKQIEELLEPALGALPDEGEAVFNEAQAASDAANFTGKLGRGSVLCEIRALNAQIKPDTFLLDVATNYPSGIFTFIAPLYASYLKRHPTYEGTLILNAYALKGERKLLMTTRVVSSEARMNYNGIAWLMEKNANYI